MIILFLTDNPAEWLAKAEQLNLFDMPVHIAASVDKHGHFRAAHIARRKVRAHEPAKPARHSVDLFGGADNAPTQAKGVRKSKKLDKFLAKHGGAARMAAMLKEMTPEQRAKLIDAMAHLDGMTVGDVHDLLGMSDHGLDKPTADAGKPAAVFDSRREAMASLDTEGKTALKKNGKWIASSGADVEKWKAEGWVDPQEPSSEKRMTVRESLSHLAGKRVGDIDFHSLTYLSNTVGLQGLDDNTLLRVKKAISLISHMIDTGRLSGTHRLAIRDKLRGRGVLDMVEQVAESLKDSKDPMDAVRKYFGYQSNPPAADTVAMPRDEAIKEHERLVDVLESPSHADDKAEAKKQKAELSEYKQGGESKITTQNPPAETGPKDGDRNAEGLIFRDGRWHREGKTANAETAPATTKEPVAATSSAPDLVEYTTKKGKVLRGIVRKDINGHEAAAIDPYTFRHQGGWFIREKHLAAAGEVAASDKPVATAAEAVAAIDPEVKAKAEAAARADRAKTQADKLRAVADKTIAAAEAEQSRDRQTNTARRASMAGSILARAAASEAIGRTMHNLANAIESGEAKHLSGVSSRAAVEELDKLLINAMYQRNRSEKLSYAEEQKRKGRAPDPADIMHAILPRVGLDNAGANRSKLLEMLKGKRGAKALADKLRLVPDLTPEDFAGLKKYLTNDQISDALGWYNVEAVQRVGRLARMGIDSNDKLRMALTEYVMYRNGAKKPDPVKTAEMALVGQKVGIDFFPTPKSLASRMAELAGVKEGMRVLEPSAGNGNLADAAKAAGGAVDTYEVSDTLRNILKLKGHNVAGHDFMDAAPEPQYDAAIMNPPFSNRMDAEHIQHAWGMVKPGGKLVAIAGEGVFFGSDKKAQAFRDWLDQNGADVEKLPEGTFLDKSLPSTTGVNARLIVLEKPAEAASAAVQGTGPKDGDRNAEGLIFRDGRWHREDEGAKPEQASNTDPHVELAEAKADLADAVMSDPSHPDIPALAAKVAEKHKDALDAENAKDVFAVPRAGADGVEDVKFRRGQSVKVGGSYPMKQGVIEGVSHARGEAKVGGIWYGFGHIYSSDYDEYKAPRDNIEASLSNVEDRLRAGNSIEAEDMIRQIQNNVDKFGLSQFQSRIDAARAQKTKAEKEFIESQKSKDKAKADAEIVKRQKQAKEELSKPRKIIRMTMDEWKKIHRDFKGKHADGSRSTLYGGAMYPVEIVKDAALSSNGKPVSVESSPADVGAVDYEGMIKIAADSVSKLRGADVDRVLEQNDAKHRQGLADYIKKNRPDLSGDVDEVMADLGLSVVSTSTAPTANTPPADTAEPDALTMTPKQYHDAKLRYMASEHGLDLSEVREMYDTDAGRSEHEQEWVNGVMSAAKEGKPITRATLDKLHEIRPGAVGSLMHDYPNAKIPESYQVPDARKAESEEHAARVANRKEIKVKSKERIAADAQAEEKAKEPKKVIRMTMDEWKKIHKDYKGKMPDDGRMVMYGGGMMAVEIVKDAALSSNGKPVNVDSTPTDVGTAGAGDAAVPTANTPPADTAKDGAPAADGGPHEGDRNADGLVFRNGRWHREDVNDTSVADLSQAVDSIESANDAQTDSANSSDSAKLEKLRAKVEQLGGKEKVGKIIVAQMRNSDSLVIGADGAKSRAATLIDSLADTFGVSREAVAAELGLKKKTKRSPSTDGGRTIQSAAGSEDDPNSPNYRFRDTGYIANSRKEMAANMLRTAAKEGRRVNANEVDWESIEHNPREAKELIVKSNLFGQVPWDSLKEQGMEPSAGFLIDRIYASIAKEPEDNPQARKDYALGLQSLRERMESCKTPQQVAEVLKEIREEQDGTMMNADESAAYAKHQEKASELQQEKFVLDAQVDQLYAAWNKARGDFYTAQREVENRKRRGWKPSPELDAKLKAATLAQDVTHKVWSDKVREVGPRRDELRTAIVAENKAARAIALSSMVRNKLENPLSRAWNSLGDRFKAVVNYRRTNGSDAFRNHVASATGGNVKDWSWAETSGEVKVKRATKEQVRFQLRVAENLVRKGGRAVKVVSTEDLKRAFGLRDVQSGNWVLKDPVSAKFHVENCAAAFSDLADLFGVPDEQVSMNGRLAMAFGARGAGAAGGKAAKAHYEPVHRVINLTKMAGGGSLAHEWAHALDNMVKEAVTGETGKVNEYASENPDILPAGELRDAFRSVRAAMLDSDGITGQRALEQVKYTANHIRQADYNINRSNPSELARMIAAAGNAEAAVIAVNGYFDGMRESRRKSTAMQDWKRIAVAYYDRNPDGATVATNSGPMMSSFAVEAMALDAGGKPYWAETHEMFARAFHAYVEDKLAEQGRESGYLASYGDNKYHIDPLTGTQFTPFPEGEERKRINAAFDKLVAAVRNNNVLAKALERLGLPRSSNAKVIFFVKSA